MKKKRGFSGWDRPREIGEEVAESCFLKLYGIIAWGLAPLFLGTGYQESRTAMSVSLRLVSLREGVGMRVDCQAEKAIIIFPVREI